MFLEETWRFLLHLTEPLHPRGAVTETVCGSVMCTAGACIRGLIQSHSLPATFKIAR